MNEIEKSKENYKKFIRKFSTYELLKYFSIKSIEDFNNKINGHTEFKDVKVYNEIDKTTTIFKNFGYGQWELVQICYNSINYSNDYRGIKVNDFYFHKLVNENKNYTNETENIPEINDIKILEHLQCLVNIQFAYQILNVKTDFNRMYHIMISINQNKIYNQTKEVSYIDFSKKFQEITGIEYDKFIKYYSFIVHLALGLKKYNLYDLIDTIKENENKLDFSTEEFILILELISKDYSFYKKSNNWNLLRFYPVVKIPKKDNEYIISNMYSFLSNFPNTMYWIIRNHYNSINSNDFTIYFGK